MHREFLNDVELLATPTGSHFIFDIECYVNYFCIAFKCVNSSKYLYFEQCPASTINIDKLNYVLWNFCLISFNGIKFDIPLLQFVFKGYSNADLKAITNKIIIEKLTPYKLQQQFKINIPNYNHIDLIEVAPLQGSLKLYAGRMHVKKMQDLPYPHDAILTQEQAANVLTYCFNDLDNTETLFKELKEQIQLRREMSKQYGVDLRSKSDAQIAEAVVKIELEKHIGRKVFKPAIDFNMRLKYNIPDFVSFKSENLINLLESIRNIEFTLNAKGEPEGPAWFEKKVIIVGNSEYTIGKGGLHSKEKSIAYKIDDETIISDNDVESFYPRIIINQKLFPAHLGEIFLEIYNSIVNRRLQGKKDNNKTIANSLKIVINGLFGKFGSVYSLFYSPQLLLQVTLTGQLVLLMLIEMLELNGIQVISGNTDGVVSKYKKTDHPKVREIIKHWEQVTNFKTEETQYKGLYCRDVNNYIAIKTNNEVKRKGVYSEFGSALNSRLSKNPENLICSEAVIALIKDNIPLEKTITECKDITKFVSIRTVEGGAKKGNIYLGKIIRWYYACGELSNIEYVKNGNKVPNSDNAKPLMELPEEFPQDVNYEWYIKEADLFLHEIGYFRKPKSLKLWGRI